MVIIEKLDSILQPMTKEDTVRMQKLLRFGSLHPYDIRGYVSQEGVFRFYENPQGNNSSITLWTPSLVNLDDRLFLRKYRGGELGVVRRNIGEFLEWKIPPEEVRIYIPERSGETTVMEGNIVLPSIRGARYLIGDRKWSYNELLTEIKKGKESEELRGCDDSFERVINPFPWLMIGEIVTYIALQTPRKTRRKCVL